MAKAGRWYAEAARVIDAAVERGRAEGLEGERLLSAVDAAYPFGPREHYPYRAWLKARAHLCRVFGLAPPRRSPQGRIAILARAERLAAFDPRLAAAWARDAIQGCRKLDGHPLVDWAAELAAAGAPLREDVAALARALRDEIRPPSPAAND